MERRDPHEDRQPAEAARYRFDATFEFAVALRAALTARVAIRQDRPADHAWPTIRRELAREMDEASSVAWPPQIPVAIGGKPSICSATVPFGTAAARRITLRTRNFGTDQFLEACRGARLFPLVQLIPWRNDPVRTEMQSRNLDFASVE